MLTALLEVILPVAVVVSVGILLARSFRLDPDTIGKINLYGLTAPLVFVSLTTTQVSAGDTLWLIIAYLIVTLLGVLLAVVFGRGHRRVVTGCVILGNNGNFGLPIALLALGQPGMDLGVVLFLVSLVLIFTVGPILLGARTTVRESVVRFLKLPVTWALIIAPALRLLDISIPVGIMRGFELLAGATVPMVLLALGVQLRQSQRIAFSRPVITSVALRTLAMPLLAYGVAQVVPLSHLATSSLVLACAMPTAVNVFMLAREYGSDPELAANTVAVTTGASLVTLSIVISLLPYL